MSAPVCAFVQIKKKKTVQRYFYYVFIAQCQQDVNML